MKAASVSDYRELARRRVPHFLFEYVDGGSYAEQTLQANEQALRELELRQRVMVDVSSINLSTSLFGQDWAMPVVLGPVGLAGMLARRGEVQAARAAEDADVPFTLSTVSCCGLEEVRRGVVNAPWFQLYMIRDRAFMRDLLQLAGEQGCKTLVFTVDMPVPGSRYRDARSGLAAPASLYAQARRLAQALRRPRWAWDVGLLGRPHSLGNLAPVLGRNSGIEDYFGWMSRNFDPRVSWQDLDFVREHWSGSIIIKGILDAEDARLAANAGVDGIVVSNHGGRQLDGVPATAQALPAVAQAVGDRLKVLVDGGVRSGLDVVRMLALGANGVMLGRAWAYALGGGGGEGVRHMLRLVEAEMRVVMALTGQTDVASVDASCLVEKASA